MIQIAQFTQEAVRNIYIQVRDYGSVWVTEDGMIHRSERAAVRRAEIQAKIASINSEEETVLRYIRIDKGSLNIPTNVAELKAEFDRQDDQRRKDRRKEVAEMEVKSAPITKQEIDNELEALAKAKGTVSSAQAPKNAPVADQTTELSQNDRLAKFTVPVLRDMAEKAGISEAELKAVPKKDDLIALMISRGVVLE